MAVLLLLAACPLFAPAQPVDPGPGNQNPRNFDATQFGERVTLGPDWLFSPGDNPAWASSTFDDSAWKTVSDSKLIPDYGYHNLRYAWYRVHIHLRPGTHHLMVGVQLVDGSYQVYANGVLIGSSGNMAGMVHYFKGGLNALPVPDGLLTARGDLVLAIRIAIDTGALGRDTLAATPLHSGSIDLISQDEAPRDASYAFSHKGAGDLILACLSLLAGLVALALYLAQRSQREYLAVAVYLLALTPYSALWLWAYLHADFMAVFCLRDLFYAIANVAIIEFVRLVLGQPRGRWLLGLEIAAFVSAFGEDFAISGVGSNIFLGFSIHALPTLLVDILLPIMLVRGWRRGNREARILLPAVLLNGFVDYSEVLHALGVLAHLSVRRGPLPAIRLASYSFNIDYICAFVFIITLLLFLALRTVRIARERAHAAAEIEAARSVQQVLIPEEVPTIPGFSIQSVYKPASEVGGDFFQILPIKSGGVMAVIGDVSGKGMPAAMTVSLLVGTVRTLAHYTQSPGEILAAMNQRMMARSGGGFTTCLVLRADPDGTLTIANAGHIAPYLGGKELPLKNGLPLGLADETVYAESTFQLSESQQLTLLTDGVVEARNKAGALYGFERTAALSGESADQIAKTAELFGQDDDITVLTLQKMVPA